MYCSEGIWKGDILVEDIEVLESLDASESHARRLTAKEVLMPKNGEKSQRLDPQMEQSSCLGKIRAFRRSILIQDHQTRDEEHKDVLQKESDASQPLDTRTDDGAARNDFWTIEGNFIYRHHDEARV